MKDSYWDTPPDKQDLEFAEPPERNGHILLRNQ